MWGGRTRQHGRADASETVELITGADADHGPYVRWTDRFAGDESSSTVAETWDAEMLLPTLRQLTPEQLGGRKKQIQAAMAAAMGALMAAAQG